MFISIAALKKISITHAMHCVKSSSLMCTTAIQCIFHNTYITTNELIKMQSILWNGMKCIWFNHLMIIIIVALRYGNCSIESKYTDGRSNMSHVTQHHCSMQQRNKTAKVTMLSICRSLVRADTVRNECAAVKQTAQSLLYFDCVKRGK